MQLTKDKKEVMEVVKDQLLQGNIRSSYSIKYYIDFFMDGYKIMSWNIRRLKNSRNNRNLKSLILNWDPCIVCLQETMMCSVESTDLGSFWSHKEVRAIHQVANGLSGEILCCWDSNLFELSNLESMQFCVGITFKDIKQGSCINIFVVLGLILVL